MTAPYRLRERSVGRPSAPHAQIQDACADTEFTRPFANGVGLSVEREDPVRSRVVRLFFWCRPSHVVRFVMTIYIDAVNAVALAWTRADMRKECCERGAPFWAHPNTPASIIAIVVSVLVATSLQHPAPNLKLGTVGHAMNGVGSLGYFSGKASTGSRRTAPQMGSFDAADTPAFASTDPASRNNRPVSSKDSQSAKDMASMVNQDAPHSRSLYQVTGWLWELKK